MFFNSLAFGFFLPVVFLIHWFILQKNRQWQNGFILLASYIFYGWWDWRFLTLIIFSTLTDYFVGLQLQQTTTHRKRKLLLAISLIINLGLLGVFKYYNFFISSLSDALLGIGINWNFNTLKIILPVGISFYTFQTLSYTIDIYRRQLRPTKDLIAFGAYVAFFPQLVAGPIERATRLLPQFATIRHFDYKQTVSGCRLILWGLFKKMVIADNLAVFVDLIYESPNDFHGFSIILATIFFAFQIYCDFSGYSDIAIGTARLLGIRLMTNFQTPYFSTSLKMFWQRWHISLSTWFRDYVYIPLGGNQVAFSLHLRNLFLTFLISGLWHGANLTFVIWGSIHGGIYCLEILWNRFVKFSFPKWIRLFLTFSVVCFGWVFFRAKTIEDAFILLNNGSLIFSDAFSIKTQLSYFFAVGLEWYYLIVSLLFFILVEIFIQKRDFNEWLSHHSKWKRWGLYYLIVVWILLFGVLNSAPSFIYFQF